MVKDIAIVLVVLGCVNRNACLGSVWPVTPAFASQDPALLLDPIEGFLLGREVDGRSG